MSLRYRKWGRSVRLEGTRRIAIDEGGEAIEDGGTFRARSLDEFSNLPAPESDRVEAVAAQIESMIARPLMIERLIISHGIVAHEVSEGRGHIRWTEQSRRIHLSIARPPLRALIDLAAFDVVPIGPVVEALRRAGSERPAPPRLRLAEHVGAALLPSLDVPKMQTAAPHDGDGQPIVERAVTPGSPPNVYRPTYRLPPRRAWFHLRAEPMGELNDDAPLAVALLAPAQKRHIRVLCVDGNAVYPATVEVTRVLAARPTATWFPYAAGAFGVEIML